MLWKGIYTERAYHRLRDRIINALEGKYGSSDQFDVDSYIDTSLTPEENLSIAEEEFGLRFNEVSDPVKDEIKTLNKQRNWREKPERKVKKGILKPLSDKIPTYNLYAFDIETTGRSNDFLMGSIVRKGYDPLIFWDKREMIDHIMEGQCYTTNRHGRLFATNLSFDLTALFQNSEEIKHMDILLRGSRIIQGMLPSKSLFDIIFLDTMNFYPFSVKKMGEIIGLEKLETPSYIKEERMPREDEMDGIEAYNVRDSEITLGFAHFIQRAFNGMGCRMRMTAASTAMDLFKRRYLTNNMYQEPMDQMKLEYNAYYGGRVEVFKRGLIRDAYYYDFNSLYPSVMRNEYPDVSSSRFKEKGNLSIIDHYEGVSDVCVSCPEDLNIPFLPYRQESKKLIFPTGIFKGWYSHAELRKALDLGYGIVSLGRQIYYTQTHHPFKSYVEDLYAIRKSKKEAFDPTELIIKLLMNSLYGKFGQRMIGKQKIYHMDTLSYDEIMEMAKSGKVNTAGDFLYYETDSPEYVSSHIMPIYALYTTAYGRIKLYDAMKDISPIYIDTDSIITHKKIDDSKEMGSVKLEYEIDEGIFIRPKMYAFKTREGKSVVRIKGNNMSWNWNYDQFKSFIANPRVSQRMFSTFRMSNRKGIPFNSIINRDKEFGMEDDKRIWKGVFNPLLMMESNPIRI